MRRGYGKYKAANKAYGEEQDYGKETNSGADEYGSSTYGEGETG